MSSNEIDETLVAYFKQMLDEEIPAEEKEEVKAAFADTQADELQDSHALKADIDATHSIDGIEIVQADVENAQALASDDTQNVSPEDDIDYASDDYMPEELSSTTSVENVLHDLQAESSIEEQDESQDDFANTEASLESYQEPVVQLQQQPKSEIQESLPYAEHDSLQSLLEKVEHKTEVATATETKTETQTKTEVKVQEVKSTVKEDEHIAKKEKIEDAHDNPYERKNVEMPKEFQALFFLVRGIRFAVPLVNLGGIFQTDKITPLFGKPKWFMGLADVRGRKMNVVDTLKWVKPDADVADKYEYMITLDKTLWSIGCDELEGNRMLSKEQVTWRQTAGNRPWLAGIVKKEMCALLHVEALIKMFENGVNLKDLDPQVSA